MDAKLFIDLLPEEDFFLDIHTAASIGCDERIRDIIERFKLFIIILLLRVKFQVMKNNILGETIPFFK